ncbi:MAG: hypothetical protein ACXWK5_00730 [Myxococcaceae bacterium]
MTSSLAHRINLLGWLVVAAGCGVSAPDIPLAASCTAGTIPVQLEQGVAVHGSPASVCQAFAQVLVEYRATFEADWGGVPLQEEQWTIRVRVGSTVDADGHTGITYHRSRIVDIAEGSPETFPHELRHVQLGPGSDDHHGWCRNFEPWEERVLGVDERTYLGCPR